MTKSRDADATRFVQASKDQAEAFSALQTELTEAYEEAGRAWSERIKTEFELWTELGQKLTATHSVPEAVQIYQQSMTQRMQMVAEDNERFAADCQKLAQKVARTMLPGWSGGSS